MFVATANTLETISPPLLDRCEVIECSGYVTDEKLAIARRFLLPRQIQECGLDKSAVDIEDEALLRVILDYTREVSPRPTHLITRAAAQMPRCVYFAVPNGGRLTRLGWSSITGKGIG